MREYELTHVRNGPVTIELQVRPLDSLDWRYSSTAALSWKIETRARISGLELSIPYYSVVIEGGRQERAMQSRSVSQRLCRRQGKELKLTSLET